MTFPERLTLRCGPVSAVDLALFAAASGDHNPLHLDGEVARSAGFERPVVHGMLTMAYAARLFTQSFGAARVRSLQTRFVGVALLGDTIELEATLQRTEAVMEKLQEVARGIPGVEHVTTITGFSLLSLVRTSYSGFGFISMKEWRDRKTRAEQFQEIKARFPGRGLSSMDIPTLAPLLRETEEHHGKYEASAPKHHWSDWYAAYLVARERGRTPEEAETDAAQHMEGQRR